VSRGRAAPAAEAQEKDEEKSARGSARQRGVTSDKAKPAGKRSSAAKKEEVPAPKPSAKQRGASPAREPAARARSRSRSQRAVREPSPSSEESESEKEEVSRPYRIDGTSGRNAATARRRSVSRPRTAAAAEAAPANDNDVEPGYSARHMRLAPPTPSRSSRSSRVTTVTTTYSSTVTSSSAATPGAGSLLAGLSSRAKVAAVIAFYFVTSLLTVFLNKALFTGPSVPGTTLFVTWTQVVAAVALTALCGSVAAASGCPGIARLFPRLNLSLPAALHALPVSVALVALLLANNLCLAYVHVSFYQVARAWTVVFNLLLAAVLFGVRPSFKEVVCCLLVAGGYAVACEGAVPSLYAEVSHFGSYCAAPALARALPAAAAAKLLPVTALSGVTTGCAVSAPLWGLAYGAAGSLLLSLYSLMLKRVMAALPGVSNAALVGYINANASVLLGAIVLASPAARASVPAFSDASFWLPTAAVAVAAYLLSLATVLQLQFTSALTHNVVGTAKAAVQSVLGWLIYRNNVTLATAAGSAVTILACAAYAYARQTSAPAKSEDDGVRAIVTIGDAPLPYPAWARAAARIAYRFVVAPPKTH
jgi:GDP-fucose transporter C1